MELELKAMYARLKSDAVSKENYLKQAEITLKNQSWPFQTENHMTFLIITSLPVNGILKQVKKVMEMKLWIATETL